jgi:protein TonB
MKTKTLILSVLVCTFCVFSLQAQSDNSADNQTQEEVYEIAEQMPQFPGGTEALLEWLQGELRYPEDAAKKGLSGMAYIQFTVDKDGTVKDIVIAKSSNPAFNNEAIRVARKMPKWISGKDKDGKDVAVRFTLPINFNIK